MSNSKATKRKAYKRIQGKIFRKQVKSILSGARPRRVRGMDYNTPRSMRKDQLPMDENE